LDEVTRETAIKLLPKRSIESNKATFGSVLNIAGSINYRGAAFLSSIAALRVGAGYVTLACPDCISDGIAAISPDIVLFPLKSHGGSIAKGEYHSIKKIIPRCDALSIGCGLSTINGDTREISTFFTRLLKSIACEDVPVIIDADGLNMLALGRSIHLPRHAILTPHPKELSRLLHTTVHAVQSDRTGHAILAAQKFSSVIILKGNKTIITDGDAIYVNTTGNSALSKAGTGDVLTGMISGFCAQGLSPFDSARLSVYLHGLAGEIGSRVTTEYGLLASALTEFIPDAIQSLLV